MEVNEMFKTYDEKKQEMNRLLVESSNSDIPTYRRMEMKTRAWHLSTTVRQMEAEHNQYIEFLKNKSQVGNYKALFKINDSKKNEFMIKFFVGTLYGMMSFLNTTLFLLDYGSIVNIIVALLMALASVFKYLSIKDIEQ